MDVGAIDRSATRGDGPLRAASPITKLVALATVIATVLVSWNVLVLAGVALALLAVALWGRLRVGFAVGLAAYPAVFALVFAFASAPDLMTAAVIVAKAVCSALAAVVVVLSTPYPQIFAPVQKVTPGLVGDALLMTYRSTFILLDKFSHLLRAAKLRSGVRAGQPVRAARATANALGGLLLYSIDLAQHDYDIMRLRGYEGRLRVAPQRSTNPRADVTLMAGALALLAVSITWRAGAASLNPYSWLVPIPPLALLASAAVTNRKVKS